MKIKLEKTKIIFIPESNEEEKIARNRFFMTEANILIKSFAEKNHLSGYSDLNNNHSKFKELSKEINQLTKEINQVNQNGK